MVSWVTSLTSDSGCPGRDEFAVDEPADENEARAAESIRWLETQAY